jgi:nucleotide-binding universal stress UspA family protein
VKTILVPIDFSGATRAVVEEAAELAASSQARVVIVHVRQAPALVADYGPPIGGFLMPVAGPGGPSAARQLARWRRCMEARKVPVETAQLPDGPPAEVIAAEAARLGADYIVMGSHGHTALYDLIVGGTASGVLRAAPCPVIIVPARRRPERKSVPAEVAHA